MKTMIFATVLALSSFAHAAQVELTCTSTSSEDNSILSEKTLDVSLNEKEISFDADFFGKIEKVVGKFTKQVKNGNLMYDTPDLTQQLDQSDLAFVFVEPALLKGGKGKIGLSVRQLGDSEGWSWYNQSYKCVQK